MHNVSIRHNPTVFEQTSTTGVYNVVTAAAHDFFEEDFVEVLDADENLLGVGRVSSVTSSSTFVLSDLPSLQPNIDLVEFIRRRLHRGTLTVHDNVTKYTTDIQNSYDHETLDPSKKPLHPHVYVTSPSIPSLGETHHCLGSFYHMDWYDWWRHHSTHSSYRWF